MQYFDHDGQELGFLEWAIRMNDDKYVCMECDTVGEFTVSTVWTGLDLNHHPTKKILIFETMLFEDGEPLDCVKWETKELAVAGHKRTVEELTKLGFSAIHTYDKNNH